jgi:hypothetical protein
MTSEFRDFARVFGSGLLESSHFANGGQKISCKSTKVIFDIL